MNANYLNNISFNHGMLIPTISASILVHLHLFGIHCVAVYHGLYLVSFGTGGIKFCTSAFRADQFDLADPLETNKKCSSLILQLLLLLDQHRIPAISNCASLGVGQHWLGGQILMSLCIAVFVAGRRVYK
uniref:Uncharacterized protein n=1 Tax=Oryza nivara TaxID=4536 RepID=A0A0E0INZ3_ORYNI